MLVPPFMVSHSLALAVFSKVQVLSPLVMVAVELSEMVTVFSILLPVMLVASTLLPMVLSLANTVAPPASSRALTQRKTSFLETFFGWVKFPDTMGPFLSITSKTEKFRLLISEDT